MYNQVTMLYPLFLLVLLGIDWASGYAIAGYVMRHGVSPYGYAFWQSFGPLVCLVIIQAFRSDLKPAQGSLVYSVLCGLIAIAIPNLLVYFVSAKVSSAIVTILANCAPIFTYPLALLFGRERFHLSRLAMVLIGSVGIFILVNPVKSHLELNFADYWLYVALLIPFCYALSAVYVSRFLPKSGSILNYAMWMLFVAAIVNSALVVMQNEFYVLHYNDFNSWLIILEILLSTAGYVLLFAILKMVGPVYYILVNAIAALTGIMYGKLIFGQSFNNITYIASGLIISAIIGLTYTQRKLLQKLHRR